MVAADATERGTRLLSHTVITDVVCSVEDTTGWPAVRITSQVVEPIVRIADTSEGTGRRGVDGQSEPTSTSLILIPRTWHVALSGWSGANSESITAVTFTTVLGTKEGILSAVSVTFLEGHVIASEGVAIQRAIVDVVVVTSNVLWPGR